jgi:hypothetical protein
MHCGGEGLAENRSTMASTPSCSCARRRRKLQQSSSSPTSMQHSTSSFMQCSRPALLLLLAVMALGVCGGAHATELPPGMHARMMHRLERHRMQQDRLEQAELAMQQQQQQQEEHHGGEQGDGSLGGRALLQAGSSAPPIRIHAEFQLSASMSAADQAEIKQVVGIAILTLQNYIQVGMSPRREGRWARGG